MDFNFIEDGKIPVYERLNLLQRDLINGDQLEFLHRPYESQAGDSGDLSVALWSWGGPSPGGCKAGPHFLFLGNCFHCEFSFSSSALTFF